MWKITTAMVLAAGRGTRMGTLTQNLPKPMLPVQGKPILETIIRQLATEGIRKVVVNVHYLPEKIIEYFKDGQAFGVTMVYSREARLLNTGGGVAYAARFFPYETIFLTNGDVWCDVAPRQLLAHQLFHQSWVTLNVVPSRNFTEYALVGFDDAGKVRQFFPRGTPPPEGIRTGIYTGQAVLHPRAVALLPQKPESIVTLLFKPLISLQKITVHVHKGKWIDFGTQKKYTQVTNQLPKFP